MYKPDPIQLIRWNVPGGQLCSYGVGGTVLGVCKEVDAEGLARVMAWCRKAGLPWRVIGGGSNLLVSDGGYPGILIRLKDAGSAEHQLGTMPTVSAGMTGARLLALCEKEGLGGIEFMDGIPGTVGGWVAGNAGAHGHAIGEIVTAVEVMTPKEECHTLRDNFGFGYRRFLGLGDAVILSVTLALTPRTSEEIHRQRLAFRQKRCDFSGLRTAGSIFKNPDGDSAGRLLDAAGCKGLCIGGAYVWERHANVIVAGSSATASDIQALIALMLRKVPRLEPEIKIL